MAGDSFIQITSSFHLLWLSCIDFLSRLQQLFISTILIFTNMKRIFGILAISLSIPFFSNAQEVKKPKVATEHITVKGVCGECKERIEKAAYIPGVKRAEWDKTTKELTVSFKTSKTTIEAIEQNIANAGHDAGDIKASDSAYNELPSCCAYKDGHDH